MGKEHSLMDMMTVVGLVVAFGAIVVNVLMEGGSLAALIKPSAMVLILGGTIGATLIGFRKAEARKLPGALASAFLIRQEDPAKMVDHLVAMAEKARREGLLSLQDEANRVTSPLLAKGLGLVVDGTDPEVVANHLETEADLDEERATLVASMLDAAGGYSPTMGIIGTVMGLVMVLQNLAEAEKLGHAIALAFLATFYGILLANVLWLPLATKVKQNIAYQARLNRMYITGVVGLQTGEAPRALRGRLEAFLEASERKGDNRG